MKYIKHKCDNTEYDYRREVLDYIRHNSQELKDMMYSTEDNPYDDYQMTESQVKSWFRENIGEKYKDSLKFVRFDRWA